MSQPDFLIIQVTQETVEEMLQRNMIRRSDFTCSFAAVFSTLPNFSELCPCQPRCERDEYRVVVSNAPLSQYAIYQDIVNKMVPSADYEAAMHIQVKFVIYYRSIYSCEPRNFSVIIWNGLTLLLPPAYEVRGKVMFSVCPPGRGGEGRVPLSSVLTGVGREGEGRVMERWRDRGNTPSSCGPGRGREGRWRGTPGDTLQPPPIIPIPITSPGSTHHGQDMPLVVASCGYAGTLSFNCKMKKLCKEQRRYLPYKTDLITLIKEETLGTHAHPLS